MHKRMYSLHQATMRDFQIVALRWSIAALEAFDGITRQSVQADIDCDKAVMETLQQGGTYASKRPD
jgi:hypothetical protein